MEDIFGEETSPQDHNEALDRQARHTRNKYVNMGFQEGIFAARQSHVQEGFDAGYRVAALRAFCREFLKQTGGCGHGSGEGEDQTRYQNIVTDESVVESVPRELEDLYEHILCRIHDNSA